MRRKTIQKVIALTLCSAVIMGCGLQNRAYAQETSDNDNDATWNIRAIEADEAEPDKLQADNIRIGILDSGIDYSNSVNVVERKDFLGENISPLYEDSNGHGTAVACIIASDGSDGSVKGINPNVDIYSAKILDSNNKATIKRVVDGIDWAIEKNVKILNLSFGTDYDSPSIHNAVKRARKAGILMFASSGNSGEKNSVEYPAAYKEVVAVGASAVDGNLSELTNDGEELELIAPGELIKSTGWLNIDCISNGTSFSVPHAVGVASLLWQKDETKSADFIRNLMKASSKHVINEEKEYSLIDYEYACKIYDDYNEMYNEGSGYEEICEELENEETADDYSRRKEYETK